MSAAPPPVALMPVIGWFQAAFMLERTRQLQGWNQIKHAKSGDRIRRWGGLAFRILWPLWGAFSGAFVFRLLRTTSVFGDASAQYLLAMLALFTALLLFVSAIKFAYQTFYAAPDIPLLQALPLPIRGVFAGKYFENLAFSNQMVSIFALGPFLAYTIAFDWPIGQMLLAVLGLLFLPVYSTSFGILVSVPISRFVAKSRMRETLMLGSMAASVGMYALMRSVIRIEFTDGPPNVESLLWDWLPVSWLAGWVIDPTNSERILGLGQYFWMGTALFMLSVWLGDMAYHYGVSHLEVEGIQSGKHTTPWLLRIFGEGPSPDRALWFKDLLTFGRDPRQWYYLVFFGVLFFLPIDPTGKMSGGGAMEKLVVNTISNAFIVIIMATMALQELSVLGISREGPKRWLIHSLPIRPAQLLQGKFSVVMLATAILAGFGVFCLWATGQLGLGDMFPTFIGSMLIACTLNFAFLALGAHWPDFEGYEQRQRVNPTLVLAIAMVDGFVMGVFLFSATLLSSYAAFANVFPVLQRIPYSTVLTAAFGLMALTLLSLLGFSLWLGVAASRRLLQEN